MMKQQGYNHNVRYKDIVFHVQTEDYGRDKPQVVTQLFHGGMILHKQSQSYAEYVQEPNVASKITSMMKEQHKAVMKKLLAGEIDIPEQLLAKASLAPKDSAPSLDDDEDQYDKVRGYLGTEEF